MKGEDDLRQPFDADFSEQAVDLPMTRCSKASKMFCAPKRHQVPSPLGSGSKYGTYGTCWKAAIRNPAGAAGSAARIATGCEVSRMRATDR
jgi:hypothetical protein